MRSPALALLTALGALLFAPGVSRAEDVLPDGLAWCGDETPMAEANANELAEGLWTAPGQFHGLDGVFNYVFDRGALVTVEFRLLDDPEMEAQLREIASRVGPEDGGSWRSSETEARISSSAGYLKIALAKADGDCREDDEIAAPAPTPTPRPRRQSGDLFSFDLDSDEMESSADPTPTPTPEAEPEQEEEQEEIEIDW